MKKRPTADKMMPPKGDRIFVAVPAEVLAFLQAVKRATETLRKWEKTAPNVIDGVRDPKHFTPDGRMVGDIGEVLAERFFFLRLEKDQKAGYDGIPETDDQTKVEIKITRKDAFQFRKITDRVIALSLPEGAREVEIVFNVPGKLLVEKVPGMRERAAWKDDHWHFDKPFNIDPVHLRYLAAADHEHRVPLRKEVTPMFKP